MPQQDGHILLIEEDPTLLDITAFRLEMLGYKVSTCQTTEQAYTWLLDNLPDLTVMGHTADVDPIEFLNRFSNDQRTSAMPVLYLSTKSDPEEVQRAYNAGADEYLVAPYDPLVLEQKIADLALALAESNSD
jgi:DNA-binding response OmpR family regulator